MECTILLHFGGAVSAAVDMAVTMLSWNAEEQLQFSFVPQATMKPVGTLTDLTHGSNSVGQVQGL